MKYFKILILVSFIVFASCKEKVNGPSVDNNKYESAMLHGSSIQISGGFDWAYYQNRSVESIAEEIDLAGYKSVHYFVPFDRINKKLIDAFHKHNIGVWLMVFGKSISIHSTRNLPAGWDKWKMELTDGSSGSGGFVYLSPFSKGYTEWYKSVLAEVMKSYPFDGFEIVESHLPGWNGFQRENYGDVGLNARLAFQKEYGLTMPNFSNSNAENYYTKIPDVYKKWIRFRVDGVNSFLNEIINGAGGIRDVSPDALVATWSLAIDAGSNSIASMKEYQAMDGASMVKAVKPDMHFFQTDWPDWLRPDLSSQYMGAYKPFYNSVREIATNLPIGLQTDVGSNEKMIRSRKWVRDFEKIATEYLGYSTTTAYEYHLGGYIYYKKPEVERIRRLGKDTVLLSFNKRVDAESASNENNYSFYRDDNTLNLKLKDIWVDGNMVYLVTNNFPSKKFTIRLSGIEDTPNLWLYEGYPANMIAEGTEVIIR